MATENRKYPKAVTLLSTPAGLFAVTLQPLGRVVGERPNGSLSAQHALIYQWNATAVRGSGRVGWLKPPCQTPAQPLPPRPPPLPPQSDVPGS
ncbi:hypothetical protein NQZ68_013717 [Dissostichus eleginoides]|nr:hypothetical protein NQZ68_013717 [Dissostichus eleginoides]